eukprot:5653120-Karenia_brevis.AAC.1
MVEGLFLQHLSRQMAKPAKTCNVVICGKMITNESIAVDDAVGLYVGLLTLPTRTPPKEQFIKGP